MNTFTKPRLKKHEKVQFDDKLSKWERFKYKFINTFFLKTLFLKIFRFVFLLGIAYVVLFPFISKISSSFMSPQDFVDVQVKIIPKYPTLDTYKAIIRENGYWTALLNTSIISVGCGLIQTFICAMVGYGLSKFKFKGKTLLFLAVLLTMIVPHETIQYSLFMQFRYFDIWGIAGLFVERADLPSLMNTDFPLLILSFTGIAFKNGLFIFVFRQFYRGVPDELEEAAYVDGAGPLKTFFRIIIPLSIPMMVTIFMFAFSWQWTDTFYSGLFYSSEKARLLMPKIVAIPSSLEMQPQYEATYKTAIRNTCGLLILLPLLIVYLFAQRTLIQGIERTGITG